MLLILSSSVVCAESRLDTVLKKGVFTVCTIGDYRPYTYETAKYQYEGIDITMAESLAKSLGAKVNWVKTTWKILMPDFLKGECGIAMGEFLLH